MFKREIDSSEVCKGYLLAMSYSILCSDIPDHKYAIAYYKCKALHVCIFSRLDDELIKDGNWDISISQNQMGSCLSLK